MPSSIPDSPNQQAIIISFLQLRRAIGWCGIALPIFLFLAFTFQYPHCSLPPSISHFYYTGLGTYFTGTLFAVAIFLFHYRMPEKTDRLAAQIAAVAALVVACCPTNPYCNSCITCIQIEWIPHPIATKLHYGAALVFFLVLAFFCICLFTKTHVNLPETPQKIIRNRLYTICGYTILICIALLALQEWQWFIQRVPLIKGSSTTFVAESIALLAFGISWLVKGETLWKDAT
jgi:hypothetical protein